MTQLKSVKKQSQAAIQIREWLKEAGWDEAKVLEDFEEFRKRLNREQFLGELESGGEHCGLAERDAKRD